MASFGRSLLSLVAIVTVVIAQNEPCSQSFQYIQTVLQGISVEQSQAINAYRHLALDARRFQEESTKELGIMKQQLHDLRIGVRQLQGSVGDIKDFQKTMIHEIKNSLSDFSESITKTREKISDGTTGKMLAISATLHSNIKEALTLMKASKTKTSCDAVAINPKKKELEREQIRKEFEEKADILLNRHLKLVRETVMQIESYNSEIKDTVESVHEKCFDIRHEFPEKEELVEQFRIMLDKWSLETEQKFAKSLRAVQLVPENPVIAAAPTGKPVQCNKVTFLQKPRSCAELRKDGVTCDGTYVIYLRINAIMVFCDMVTDGGGWTVIMRRKDANKKQINFDRSWLMYTRGFGNILGEFWLGNNYIHYLTELNNSTLRINLESFDNDYINMTFEDFSVGSLADSFPLRVGNETSGKGDVGKSFRLHDGQRFSTSDRFADGEVNCAAKHQAGWWYEQCGSVLLTAPYYQETERRDQWQGIQWNGWKDGHVLKYAEMKIRPKNFDPDAP